MDSTIDTHSLGYATKERVEELRESLGEVRARMSQAVRSRKVLPSAFRHKDIVLVAVSKYKPAEDILACHEEGHQVDFGENYVQELVDKAAILPQSIQWHYIGTLQSNKCKVLAAIPNLFAIQTLDTAKKATMLDKALPSTRASPLNVYIQINTSGENSKSGLPPLRTSDDPDARNIAQVTQLTRYILSDCPQLYLRGLMTIGSIEQSASSEGNEDFSRLIETATILEDLLRKEDGKLNWGVDGALELSMGMSGDFEQAIRAGSGVIRVGTAIFGQRRVKPNAVS
ncbi:uncharacterized protein EI90DRAFT_2906044 [Cantharellus anzutake]|uniref:uncharacterized protein n=1 Tax=Cantharellus anzutake TaxID=1750568 RepID=UPI0019042308|nr:uncharacterized protein EI90DRAFT_2906044 [Cantharellus anzutake]KAF8340529.1 hypothetical protein EI90DRAFT_2906044 [Cantharellus anzutake]